IFLWDAYSTGITTAVPEYNPPGSRDGKALDASAEEFVTEPVDGDEVLGRLGIGLNSLSETRDMDVDRACQRHVVVPPHLREQFIPGKRRPAVLDEMAQQLELPGGQVDRAPRA